MSGVLSVSKEFTASLRVTATLAVAAGVALRLLVQTIRKRRTPPGQMGLPMGLGETISCSMFGFGAFVQTRVKKYGEIFKTHVLFSPTIFVTGEENVKWFFKTLKDVGAPEHFKQLLGNCFITVNGQQHKFQRKLVGRAFTDEALSSYLPNIEQLTEEHLRRCMELSGAGPFNPREEIERYTFAVAERVALGNNMNAEHALDRFATWKHGFESLTSWNAPFTTFGRAMRARQSLLKEYKEVLDKKRCERQGDASGLPSPDVVSNVLLPEEGGAKLTDQEILDILIVILFGAHDTTLAVIQSMMKVLGQQPELRAELEAEVAGLWDGKSPLSYTTCTKSAVKCIQFIAEILRVYPPITAIFRELPEDITYKGYRFPKGWKVAISIEYEHLAGKSDLDGDSFDFSVKHGSLPLNQNIPFGNGLRLCVGYKLAKLELTVWLIHFLAKYKLTVHDSSMHKFLFNHWAVKVSVSSSRS